MDGYYDVNSDPVGIATGEVVDGVQEAQAVASNVYNQLLTGMSNVRTQLEALQVAMQSAASNAQAAGEDQAGIIDAVNSAAQAFCIRLWVHFKRGFR